MATRLLIAIELLLALTAIPAGLMMVLDPAAGGSLSLDPGYLEGSPFGDYLVPGLFLAGVIGLGNLTAATLLLGRWLYAGETSLLMGVILMTWIVVQATIIPFNFVFHPLFFAVGVLIFVMALRERRHRVIEHFYPGGHSGVRPAGGFGPNAPA